MSQYYFAVHQGEKIKGGKAAAAKADKIARKIDKTAGYNYYYDEAQKCWRGWGYCRNYGAPFDSATATDIQTAWREAGLSC